MVLKKYFFVLLTAAIVVFCAWKWRQVASFQRVIEIMPAIHSAAEESNVDPYLLAGLVYAESRGRSDALSSVKAQGYCQLMPFTAAEVAGKMKIPGPPYSPSDNLRMGAFYLAQMQRRWEGDDTLALLSYRLGAARVARELKKFSSKKEYLESMEIVNSPLAYCYQISNMRQEFYRYETR